MNSKTYPRTNDRQTVYLNTVIGNPMIEVGDYTIYNDFVNDPTQFEKNNVLYHYPVNGDRLVIGKFCSTVPTTRWDRWPTIRSRSFSRSGGWTGRMSPRRGTTKATS